MVAEIEDAGKTRSGELALFPRAVVALRVDKVTHAAENGRMVGHAGRKQAQECPSRLRCGGLPLTAKFRSLIGIGRLAPSAIGLLVGQQPFRPGYHDRIVRGDADSTNPVRTCHVP